MRIRILLCHFDADPDPSFYFDADPDPSSQFKAQNLVKVLKWAHIPYILAWHHLQIDPDPAYHFDADPDPDLTFNLMRSHADAVLLFTLPN
jgi:hypothetical protein